jgi:hypothetical protein
MNMALTAKKVRIIAILGLALLAGCQEPDVGQSCSLRVTLGGEPLDGSNTPAVFVQNGATECENLVCVLSPNPGGAPTSRNNPYCSKTCVSDGECSPDQTGLRCRRVAPDQALLDQLSEEERAQFTGGNSSSFYCVLPE